MAQKQVTAAIEGNGTQERLHEGEEEVQYLCPFPLVGPKVKCSGRIYQLGTKRGCFHFRNFADSLDGFSLEYSEKGKCVVWSKKIPGEPLNIIKGTAFYPFASSASEKKEISCELLYDMLQDANFRREWDDYRADAFCIAMLDHFTEIGYYAGKSPMPFVSPRDFVTQRQWHAAGKGEYIIWNTSVPHNDVSETFQDDVRKGVNGSFVRALSKVTGYFIQPWKDPVSEVEKGVCLTYITHSDIRGSIPTSICNFLTKKIAPKTLKKIEKAMRQYKSWREAQIKRGMYKMEWASKDEWWSDGLDVTDNKEKITNITISAVHAHWNSSKGVFS